MASRRFTKPMATPESYRTIERVSAYVAGVALGTALAVVLILLAFAAAPFL